MKLIMIGGVIVVMSLLVALAAPFARSAPPWVLVAAFAGGAFLGWAAVASGGIKQ